MDDQKLRNRIDTIDPTGVAILVTFIFREGVTTTGIVYPSKDVEYYQISRDALWNLSAIQADPTPVPVPTPDPIPVPEIKPVKLLVKEGVNVRSAPEIPKTGKNVIGGILANTVIIAETGNEITADGHVWIHVPPSLGWIAKEFTEPYVEPQPLPSTKPILTNGYKQLGINFVGPGSPNNVQILSNALHASNTKLGPTIVINEGKAVPNIDATLLAFRVKIGTGRAEPDPLNYNNQSWTVEQWYSLWIGLLSQAQAPGLYLKFHNELNWKVRFAERLAWEMAFMKYCANQKKRILYGNFSVGGFNKSDIPAMKPMLELGRDLGHVLCGNTYWYTSLDDGTPNSDAIKTLEYMIPLVQQTPDAPWIHGEYGFADNDASYAGGIMLQKILNQHRKSFQTNVGYFLGSALWAENGAGGGWPQSSIPSNDYPVIVKASI